MKAVFRKKYGSTEVIQFDDYEIPAITDDQVLIKVKAASINPADIHILTGSPFPARLMEKSFLTPKRPVLGRDVAGVIESVGSNVSEFAVGDEIYGEISGSFAEFAVASPKVIAKRPKVMSFAEAAGVPLAAATALQSLRDYGNIQPKQKVLIVGASGGVGTYAVQIAKALGAHVTGVCSSDNMGLVKTLGTDQVIDYKRDSYIDSGNYDLILDNIGSHSLKDIRKAMNDSGIYISVGGPKQMRKMIPRMLAMEIGSRIRRSKKMTQAMAKAKSEDLQTLAEMIDAGKIKTVIDKTYSLEKAVKAFEDQIDGHAQGKKIIEIL